MASQGPFSPDAFANETSVGSTAWSALGAGIAASDDDYLAVTLTASSISYFAFASDFDFSVSGTILGILAEVERHAEGTDVIVNDVTVKLFIAGAPVGNNKANLSDWPTTDGTAAYGNSTDLWGLTPSAAEINAVDFGVGVSVRNNGSELASAHIDHVKMTVWYTGAGGGKTLLQSRKLACNLLRGKVVT